MSSQYQDPMLAGQYLAGQYQDAAAPNDAYPVAAAGVHGQPGHRTASTSSYLELGKLGATVGLCGAAAANLHRAQNKQISGTEAVLDSLRTSVAAGLATAAAGYMANQFRSPTTSLAATLIAGTAIMYFLNTETRSRPQGDD